MRIDSLLSGLSRSPRSPRVRAPFGEQSPHLVVARLIEIRIELSDRAERRRRPEAGDVVGDLAEPRDRARRAHRHGGHDGRRALLPDGADRREEGRSGRHAVVHDDHRAAFQTRRRPLPAVGAVAALELRGLAGLDVAETGGRDAERPDQIFVENFDAPRGDRSDGELFLSGSAELPYDEDVERRAEGPGNLEPDRHPAARQGEHEHIRPPGESRQHPGEAAAGVAPVPEADRAARVSQRGLRGAAARRTGLREIPRRRRATLPSAQSASALRPARPTAMRCAPVFRARAAMRIRDGTGVPRLEENRPGAHSA